MKILFSVLSATALFIGCGHKETVVVPTEPKNTSQGPTKEAAPGRFLFVSQNTERVDTQDSTSAIPAIRAHHRAILYCTDLLTNRTYEANWRLIDPDGNDWKLSNSKLVTTPTMPIWNMWCTFNPPERPPKAGVWRWEVSILDGPTYRREFTMIAPSRDEMAQLAQYEKARETAFRAFAHRWLGHEGFYFGFVSEGIAQLSGLAYRSRTDYVSPADKMNGISYKGRIAFSFQTFRVFGSDGRWTDWKDTVEYESSFSEFMGETFAGNLPVQYQKGFDMNFTLQERDGHWRVWSDTGAIYLNNRVLRPTQAAPPSEARVTQALKGGSSRTDSAAQGESIRNTPIPSEADITKTMDLLRGRSL